MDKTQIMSPTLFVRPDGRPMVFSMAASGAPRQGVKDIIERGGGSLHRRPFGDDAEYVIKLAKDGDIHIDTRTDFFDYNYIFDCEKHNDIVSNLKDYRLGQSHFKDYEPLDVLNGLLKWKDIPRGEIGESVPDIEYAEAPNKPVIKGGRLPYSEKEDKEILKWISDNGAYNLVKGNEMWKAMERDNVGKGRTYQSLKERFLKKIFKTIGSYSLSEDLIENFKFGMGKLDDELVGTRVQLLEQNYNHKKDSSKKHPKSGEETEESQEGTGDDEDLHESEQDTVEDPEEFCSKCQPDRQRSTPHKKVCSMHKQQYSSRPSEEETEDDPEEFSFNCEPNSRPSMSRVKSPKNPSSTRSPTVESKKKSNANDALETLLEKSDIDFSEKGSESTEADLGQNDDNPEPGPSGVNCQAQAKLPVPKKLTRQLFNDRKMETPASSVKKAAKKKGKDYQIESIPPSTLEFGIGLREASKAKSFQDAFQSFSEDTEEEDVDREGLTSTQFIGDEVESSRSAVFRTKRNKAKDAEKSKAKAKKATKRPIAEDVIDEDQEEEDGLDHTKSIDLLHRHIDDQLKMKRKKIQTQDLISALNNVETDEENNDEVPIATEASPSSFRGSLARMGVSANRNIITTDDDDDEDEDDEVSFVAPASVSPIVSEWETSTIKSGRFFNEGSFMVNFRVPYSKKEEKAIVNFFLKQGGFGCRKGVAIWKRMQAQEVCPNRTWQSMKARWEKFIMKSLAKYDVTVKQLEDSHRRIYGRDEGDDHDESSVSGKENRRGERRNANKYTIDEDKKIIHYILENKRWQDVKGRSMWEMLADREIVPGRTWQSLKERFIKIIKRNLKDNPHFYGLDKDKTRKLLFF